MYILKLRFNNDGAEDIQGGLCGNLTVSDFDSYVEENIANDNREVVSWDYEGFELTLNIKGGIK